MAPHTSVQREGIPLTAHGLTPKRVRANLGASELIEEAIRREEGLLSDRGAFTAITSPHTGRSPKDKFVVDEPGSSAKIWWEKNERMSPEHFVSEHNAVARQGATEARASL